MYGQEPDQDDLQRALAQYAQMQGQGGMQPAPQSPMLQHPPQQPMPAQAMGAASQMPPDRMGAMNAAKAIGAGAGGIGIGGAGMGQAPAAAATLMAMKTAPVTGGYSQQPMGAPGGPPQGAQPQPGQGPATMGRAPQAGGALPAAAAAKGMGAAGAGVPVAAVLMQYLDKQRQNAQMAQQQRQHILAQRAGELGAPMYGVQAAQTRRAMADNEGADYLSPLLKYFGR